jgi:protein TonB
MIKAKEVSLKNVAIFLVVGFAVSAGLYLSKPQIRVSSIPVFMAEEVTVQKTATAVEVAPRTVVAEKVIAVAPVAQPPVAAPLPIVPPTITLKVFPAYPTAALEKGLEGTVLLSVFVGLNGQSEKIETRASSGVAELDLAAAAALAQWKFSPAAQGGQALASWFEVPVRFSIK